MAKITFYATLEPSDDGGLGVTFPDLPGCVSYGADADEAVRSAEEALSLHLEGMAEEGEPRPEPNSLVKLIADHTLAGGQPSTWAAITVETPEAAERVNIYLSKSLLERIDAYCRDMAINRSAFFVHAAKSQFLQMRPRPMTERELNEAAQKRFDEGARAGLERLGRGIAANLQPPKRIG